MKEDLKEIGLDYLTFEDIKLLKKYKMRKIIKEACSNTAFNYLIQKKGSKMENLKYFDNQIK